MPSQLVEAFLVNAMPLSVARCGSRRKRPDHVAHEGTVGGHLSGRMELDIDELTDAIDGQEHVTLALGGAELGTVDVDVADLGLPGCLAFGACLFVLGQSGDAVTDQAAMQDTAGELGDGVAQASEHIVERQQGASPELDDIASSASVNTVLRALGRITASTMAERLRHFRTVLGLRPYWVARARDDACAAWSSARTRGVSH